MLAVFFVFIIFLFFLIKIKIKASLRGESGISRAVRELLAVSGTIYLSLDALLKFIGVKIPDKVIIGTIALKPLPTFALFLAIIQPFGEVAFRALRRTCGKRNN